MKLTGHINIDMEISIRGALGTQLFEYLCGLYTAQLTGQEITGVRINSGGKVVAPVKTDWLSQIIHVPYSVEVVAGTAKQDVWKKPNVFKSLAQSNILESIKLKRPVEKNGYRILHVRGLDRTIASLDDYIKLAKNIGPTVKFVGDDDYFIDNIQQAIGIGENISKSVLDDWHACIGADEIYCAFTNFTLSALLFDKTKKFYMLNKHNSHGTVKIHDPAYACVDAMFNHYFTNAKWM